MLTSELDYKLPPGLIAQTPIFPRDHSRLLILNRASGEISHKRFPALRAFLRPGDILAYNDSRVLKARVHTEKQTGGKVEFLFLRQSADGVWEALVKPSSKLREGSRLRLPEESASIVPGLSVRHHFELKKSLGQGRWLVKNISNVAMDTLLEHAGRMPLPPYIKESLNEPERYQTVYSREPCSAAAPTAGLHFTPELISEIESAGVRLVPLTLDIGLDTFRPISEQDLSLHEIHSEHYRISRESHKAISLGKKEGGRVIAVGTTAVRVLETVFAEPSNPLEGETRLFIKPGHRFRMVDGLLTNFHLPKSTLLALVMAFAGKDETRRVYDDAIREKYRFYSFGDAMLVV